MVAEGPTVSVLILARDEDAQIADCLASAVGADERLVLVDGRTQDATAERSRRAGATVWGVSGTLGAMRAAGDARATGDWLLWLDADERLPEGGLARVRAAVSSASPRTVGFKLPILTHLGARPLRWGGYFPARRLRLYRRGRARWAVEDRVHERPSPEGRVVPLGVVIEHLSYRDLAHARQKVLAYARVQAEVLRAAGRRPSALRSAVRSGWRFLSVCLLRGGWLMGRDGWALAVLQAQAVWLRGALARRRSE